MRFVRFVQLLAPFAGRVAGSEAERYCQETLAGICSRAGAIAQVQGFVCDAPPAWFLAAHGVALMVVLLLGLFQPVAAALAATLLALSLWAEGEGGSPLRTLVPRRISSNMVARFARAEPRWFAVVVAHADVARAAPWPFRFPAAVSGPVRRGRFFGYFVPLSLAIVEALLMLGWALGLSTPTPVLILLVALALFLLYAQVWHHGRPAGGALDNGSGLAVLAALAERWGEEGHEDIELWLCASGAREIGSQGVRALLRRYAHRLPPDRTVVLDLDDVGVGSLAVVSGLRRFRRSPFDPDMLAWARNTAGLPAVPELWCFGSSDASEAVDCGYSAITLTALEGGDHPPAKHRVGDRSESLDSRTMRAAFEASWSLLTALPGLGTRLPWRPAPGPARRVS
jgi:hypothetical protein